ncbi:MAG: MoxR family ATPase, partial [Bacteroidales bacterium]|nr:MoxR family ATPase [Bacteroidales bacterium]
KNLYIDDNLIKYIAQIVDNTRNNSDLFLEASPRASLNIMNAAKANAALSGRDFVIPDDIKYVAYPVLRHRIILSPEKEMESATTEKIIKKIINTVEVPR